MRDHSIAVSISLFFHIIVIALFLSVPFDQYVKPKLMVLDFSLVKEQFPDNGDEKKSHAPYPESHIENKNLAENKIKQEENVQKDTTTNSAVKKQASSGIVASDPVEQAIIAGDVNRVGIQSGKAIETGILSGKSSQNIVASSGNGKILNFEKNSPDERDFAFIRDTILRKIKDKYPERARRMGWEGKVLLSFDLFENGSIHNVKIINSSGFRILDDSARDVIEKTTFTQKIPYSRTVQLPVEFRLQ